MIESGETTNHFLNQTVHESHRQKMEEGLEAPAPRSLSPALEDDTKTKGARGARREP